MNFTLIKGTFESNSNLDGWVITSVDAQAEGSEDVVLLQGDRITLDGDVYRDGDCIANIS